jgi:hypothetical protein
MLAGVMLAGVSVRAQNVPIIVAHPVAVGAITRDAGVYSFWTGPKDAVTIQNVNKFLFLLESDLAAKVSSMKGVSYQDRTATAELMHEVHMSSGREFDSYTGALHGLMGRLDFLIVIDAIDPATAKMRLIDVQSGSVKGIESCTRSARGNAACVTSMSERIMVAARENAGAVGDLVAAREAIMAAKPQFDDQVARYDAAKAYWEHIQSTIAGAGHSLRPEIRTLLNGSATDVSTGRYAVEHFDVDSLKTATSTLTAKLDKLDEYR